MISEATIRNTDSPSLSGKGNASNQEAMLDHLTLFLCHVDRILYAWVAFHAFFFFLIAGELILLLFFLSSLLQSSLCALTIAALFFSLFAFLLLRLFLLSNKNRKLDRAQVQFLEECKEKMRFRDEILENHITLAHLAENAAVQIQGREYRYYPLPVWLSPLTPFVERLSSWLHGKDLFLLQELFLETAIEEHMSVVKKKPTRLEVHANLANAYVMLSGLYVTPPEENETELFSWKTRKIREEIEEKFRATAQKAVEELHILKEYAPNDPWVHAQLAYSYHDLQMPLEEIHEYETIYRLCPEDKETLFRLGILYFQQGFNAKGLQVYEELRRCHYHKAEQLIHYYGNKE